MLLFPGLTESLVDSFFDPSETVAHAISKALKDIARKKPIIVLKISGTYLKKHVKVCIRFICVVYLISVFTNSDNYHH